MRLNLYLFIFVLFLIIFSLSISAEITGESITGEIVTGEAIQQALGLNISVIMPPPTLTLITPENETYIDNQTILLNYSASNEDAVWYNLDDGTNNSITNNIQLSVSEGSHIINLYANNTKGVVTQNVTFFVNNTRFIILHEEYKGDDKGNSTNFSVYSYEDLQNLSDIVLENTKYGKISFSQAINLTDDENFNDNELDLDSYTNISGNRIELNSTALPNFNKTATLSLYNLSFSDPRILRDGVVCPTSICTEISYSGGTLIFNVTGFTIYSAEETPVEVPPVTTGGSGGGGITQKIKEDVFKVDKEIIKVKLKRTKEVIVLLTVENIYDSDLVLEIKSPIKEKESLTKGLFLIVDEKVKIEKEKSKEVQLIFKADEDLKLGVYVEKIEIKAKVGNIEKVKEIPVIIEVESEKVIFDVSVDIPPKYREVFAGEKLLIQPTIFNLGEVEETEVLINYLIKDFEGNTIFFEEERIIVGDQESFSKKINIPEDTKPGDYVFIMQTIYLDSMGTSSNIFRVKVERSFLEKYWVSLILIIIIILVLIIILILKRKQKKLTKSVKRIKELHKTEVRKAKKFNRTKDKIEILEKAYIGGHIKKSSYEKVKERMKNLFRS